MLELAYPECDDNHVHIFPLTVKVKVIRLADFINTKVHQRRIPAQDRRWGDMPPQVRGTYVQTRDSRKEPR